jgi:hypothetical protein
MTAMDRLVINYVCMGNHQIDADADSFRHPLLMAVDQLAVGMVVSPPDFSLERVVLGLARVHCRQTKTRKSPLAVLAASATDVEGQANHVTNLDLPHGRTNLDDLSQIFMAENLALFHIGATSYM